MHAPREEFASIQRDASLMRELRATEAWDCVVHRLNDMETQALHRIVNESVTMDSIGYWRGRLSAIREVKIIPDLLIAWSENNEPG